MASQSASLVEKNPSFVIKLKLVGLGAAPQIRRVRLKCIATKEGSVSYDELVGMAIQFTFPNSTAEHFDDFDVTLTYYDVDNDCVTLASTEELIDAIEQYVEDGSGTLRLTTDVKKKKKHSRSSKEHRDSASRASSTLSSDSTHTPTEVSPNEAAAPSLYPTAATSSTPSSNHQRINGPQVLEALLESFVGILAAAVIALQSHLAPSSSNVASQSSVSEAASPLSGGETATPAVETSDGSQTASEESSETPEVAINAEPEQPEPDIVIEPQVCNMPPPRQVLPPQTSKASVATAVTSSTSASDSTAPVATTATRTEEEERPFIHGRHTCDGCLCTPIIGKRFHAINLKDYDLCERCMENYKGSEIRFEEAELDRDRVYQERWSRRRQKWSHCRRGDHNQGRPNRVGPHGPPHPPCPPPHVPPHPPCPPPHVPPHPPCPPPHPPCPPPHVPPHPPCPPPFGLPPFGLPPFGAHHHFGPPPFGPSHPFGPQMFQSTNGANSFEDALKEAIQRSLKDMMEKVASKPEEARTEEPAPELVRETPTPAVVLEEIPTESVAEAESTECVTMSREDVNDEVSLNENSVVVVVVADEKENSVVVVADEKEILTAVSTDVESVMSEIESAALEIEKSVFSTHEAHNDDVETKDEAMTEDEGTEKSEESCLVEKFDELVEEPSFSSDAAGNGDVAEALGQTLDRCAREIDAMVSELNRHDDNMNDHDDEDSDFPSQHGATILESVGGEDKPQVKDDEKSEDGWQVVIEEEQVTEDEALARAAQFVGSALFNSDISARSAVISTLSGSGGSISTALSVPTVPSVVPSIEQQQEDSSAIPSAQLSRWAVQLKQLHELGFYDDKASIAILERIAAANLGADLFEEVTVTQVVNDLLNGKMN